LNPNRHALSPVTFVPQLASKGHWLRAPCPKHLFPKTLFDDPLFFVNLIGIGDNDDEGLFLPGYLPGVSVKYYFMDWNHPVVFFNTSNHAMAEHDTNDRVWKW
jgi:hypothetical protein